MNEDQEQESKRIINMLCFQEIFFMSFILQHGFYSNVNKRWESLKRNFPPPP